MTRAVLFALVDAMLDVKTWGSWDAFTGEDAGEAALGAWRALWGVL
jgi:hypothetical protein